MDYMSEERVQLLRERIKADCAYQDRRRRLFVAAATLALVGLAVIMAGVWLAAG